MRKYNFPSKKNKAKNNAFLSNHLIRLQRDSEMPFMELESRNTIFAHLFQILKDQLNRSRFGCTECSQTDMHIELKVCYQILHLKQNHFANISLFLSFNFCSNLSRHSYSVYSSTLTYSFFHSECLNRKLGRNTSHKIIF